MKTHAWTLGLLALAAACSDETSPIVAATLTGSWRLDVVTMKLDPNAAPVTLSRTSAPMFVRGDYEIAPLDAATATLRGNLAIVDQGLLAGMSPMEGRVTLDGDRWLISTGTETTVFVAAYAGDALTLTYDPADTRNHTENPPQALYLTRVVPETQAVGHWTLTLMRKPGGGSVDMSACQAVDAGRWARVNQEIDVSTFHMVEVISVQRLYGDDACTQSLGDAGVQWSLGIAEEYGDQLRLWLVDRYTGEKQSSEWLFSRSNDTMHLTRMSCLPAGCEADQPTYVEVEQRSPWL